MIEDLILLLICIAALCGLLVVGWAFLWVLDFLGLIDMDESE
jgi:hypothetical protein